MNENLETQIQEEIKTTETAENDAQPQAGEFKVTVRKLEMPVRPRGVLAE